MPIRLPHSHRWSRVHLSHTVVGLMLAFTLMAVLACDENAMTETRVPAGAPQGNLDDEPGAVPFDGGTLSAIGLPVNQSVATTAPAPAFRINQTGTGPNGIFQITRSGSTQTALQAVTNGKGRAGLFRISNATSTQSALDAQSNGSGPVVRALATGSGEAGSFRVNNTSSEQFALRVETNGQAGGVYAASTHRGEQRPAAGHFEGHGNSSGLAAISYGSGSAATISAVPSTVNTYALWVVGSSNFAHPEAAMFQGDVRVEGTLQVAGTLIKDAGSFRINHPLDPEHKYLSHSFVESPDMMNVYNGNVTLDASGRATVELPDYFEALNRDFRYQLTAIGAPGPNLYVAEGVKQNRFRIAGGRPYARVSWQVTGVRQDTYANEHRIKVEEDKASAGADLMARR